MPWYATKKASKLPSMDKSRIVVFDVETTGLSATVDEILQLSIMDGYGNVLFSSYIKPTRHRVWIQAQRVNGISYAMVKDSPTIRKVKKEIQAIFDNALLVVGYNISFDIGFLEAAGIAVTGKQFDVMTAFKSYRSGIEHRVVKRCTLKKCAQYFGYTYNAHDSEEDVRATLYCFNELISDERFTTYKKRKKKQIKEEYSIEKRKIGFSLVVQMNFTKMIVISLIMIAGGIGGLSWYSKIVPLNISEIRMIWTYVLTQGFSLPAVAFDSMIVLGELCFVVQVFRKIRIFPKKVAGYLKKIAV